MVHSGVERQKKICAGYRGKEVLCRGTEKRPLEESVPRDASMRYWAMEPKNQWKSVEMNDSAKSAICAVKHWKSWFGQSSSSTGILRANKCIAVPTLPYLSGRRQNLKQEWYANEVPITCNRSTDHVQKKHHSQMTLVSGSRSLCIDVKHPCPFSSFSAPVASSHASFKAQPQP